MLSNDDAIKQSIPSSTKNINDSIKIIEDRKTNTYMSREKSENYNDTIGDTELWFENIIFPLFCRHIKPGDKVLDVGCGTGRVSMNFAKYGCSVTGVDASPYMLEHFRENAKSAGLKVEILEANAKALPFADNTFDAVVSMWFLQHFANWQEFLTEQIRVAKNGGAVAFEFSFKEHEYLAHSLVGNRISQYVYTDDVEPGASGRGFYATTTMPELTDFCKDNGVSISAIMPHSLLTHNAFLMDATTIDVCRQAKNEIEPKMIRNEDIVKYAQFYESEMVSKMPYWYTRRCIIVLRKNG